MICLKKVDVDQILPLGATIDIASSMKPPKVCRRLPPPPPNSDNEPGNDNNKPSSNNILKLPMEITAEIFHKLPGKTLVQCKHVCTSWRCCLSNPQFTKPLFRHTRGCLLIRGFTDLAKPSGTVLIDLDHSTPNHALRLPRDPNLSPLGLTLVGSCNGLLCLTDHSSQFYVSNPITGESLALPTTNKNQNVTPYVSGFGFSPTSRVYKVLVLTFPVGGSEAMVLTVGSGSWRSIGKHSLTTADNTPDHMVYLDGSLHWIKGWRNGSVSICAFDVQTEQFRQLLSFIVPVRKYLLKHCDLGVVRGCLSLFVHKRNVHSGQMSGDISVWVMKDYGVEESWTKEYEIGGNRMSSMPRVLEYTEQGQTLMLEYEKLHVYTPIPNRKLVRVEAVGMPSNITNACVHIPSFVPLYDMIRGT